MEASIPNIEKGVFREFAKLKLLEKVRDTYIRVSLEADPPATFWTRREASSCLRSSSCFFKSAFDRARSSFAFGVFVDYHRELATCFRKKFSSIHPSPKTQSRSSRVVGKMD